MVIDPRISARTWKLIHATLGTVWVLLIVPTLLWWRHSILWVAFMSLYANIAAHWAAAQASSADEHANSE